MSFIRPGRGSPPVEAIFPLQSGGRTLLQADGTPWLLFARTSWFITSLTWTEQQSYISDCLSKGFNAIEFHVINHDARGRNPPQDGDGNLPFTTRLGGGSYLSTDVVNNINPDFETPNSSYWSNVDRLISYCQGLGILCLMFPAYVGYQGGEQGWMQEMKANGDTKMQNYGSWIASRYSSSPNIIWMLGGDYGLTPTSTNGFSGVGSPSELSVESALITGMRSVTGVSQFYNAEWDGPNHAASCTDGTPDFGTYINLNGVYSWQGETTTYGRLAWDSGLPSHILETCYDEEGPDGHNYNPNATQPVRRFYWRGWLATVGGLTFGNGYVWQAQTGWETHLSTTETLNVARLVSFARSLEWWRLIPDNKSGIGVLVTSGAGTIDTSTHVTASATSIGDLLVAYCGLTSANPTIDMTKMRGSTTARWFDPTDGSYQTVAGGPFANTGTRTFTKPGNNSAGDGDWVLRLDA
jgi:hypothetical protein